jgi:putative membrane protein
VAPRKIDSLEKYFVNQTKRIGWLLIYIVALIWSAIRPKDYPTWLLEVAPALAALVILAAPEKSYPLTRLSYVFILIHCIILMVDGHYTYADVPPFDYIRELTQSTRNNYDKPGHFAQGFVPALVARELVIRNGIIPSAGWRNFFIVCFCLAVSAFYEFIEWWVALLSSESAEALLGTQGYIWNTQSDMFFDMLGVIASLVLLGRLHDRQLKRLTSNT